MVNQYQAEREIVIPENYDAVILERSYLREEMRSELVDSARDEQGQ